MLDVACGTGLEDKFLKLSFHVTGMDLNSGVLRIARRRNPELTYLSGDMRTFRFENRYDVITCFDAMCYLRDHTELRKTFRNFHRHLLNGGVLVFYLDPVFLKEHHKQDTIVITKKHNQEKHITLIELYRRKGRSVEGNAVYMIQESSRVRFEIDNFETFGFFDVARIKRMLRDTGFRAHLYSGGRNITFSLRKYNQHSPYPIFVCEK